VKKLLSCHACNCAGNCTALFFELERRHGGQSQERASKALSRGDASAAARSLGTTDKRVFKRIFINTRFETNRKSSNVLFINLQSGRRLRRVACH
jgi:hypothetical protein